MEFVVFFLFNSISQDQPLIEDHQDVCHFTDMGTWKKTSAYKTLLI